jgi:hypothetical protein
MVRRKAVLALMIGLVSVIGLFASDKDCGCTPKTKTQDCGCAPETKTTDCACAPEKQAPGCACAPENQAPDCACAPENQAPDCACAPENQAPDDVVAPFLNALATYSSGRQTAQQNTTPPEAETVAGAQQ